VEVHQPCKSLSTELASCCLCCNQNYQGQSGTTIDELWGLADLKNRTPTWHAYYIPRADETGKDGDGLPPLVPFSGSNKQIGKAGGKKRLAIMDGYESAGSMPSLQTITNSSDEVDFDSSDDDSDGDYESDEEGDNDDEFDEELEDELREMIRDAMDLAQADPDFHDPRSSAKFFDDMAADKKDNHFLKLLGSLRGMTVCVYHRSEIMSCVRSSALWKCGTEDYRQISAS
jgi:hypothetical protein